MNGGEPGRVGVSTARPMIGAPSAADVTIRTRAPGGGRAAPAAARLRRRRERRVDQVVDGDRVRNELERGHERQRLVPCRAVDRSGDRRIGRGAGRPPVGDRRREDGLLGRPVLAELRDGRDRGVDPERSASAAISFIALSVARTNPAIASCLAAIVRGPGDDPRPRQRRDVVDPQDVDLRPGQRRAGPARCCRSRSPRRPRPA